MADKQNPDSFSHPYPCVELARSWLLIRKAVGETPNLAPAGARKPRPQRLENAQKCVRAAQKKELFKDPKQVRFFHSQKDLEPLWELVPRMPD